EDPADELVPPLGDGHRHGDWRRSIVLRWSAEQPRRCVRPGSHLQETRVNQLVEMEGRQLPRDTSLVGRGVPTDRVLLLPAEVVEAPAEVITQNADGRHGIERARTHDHIITWLSVDEMSIRALKLGLPA